MDTENKIKILVVEDEADARNLYIDVLKGAGYEVYSATNGQEALELVEKMKVDLILLDIVMPVKDGVHMLADLKKLQSIHTPKVLAFSNIGGEKVTDRVIDLGADAYMLKSEVDVNDLATIIQTLLHKQ